MLIIEKSHRYRWHRWYLNRAPCKKEDQICGGDKTFLPTMSTHPAVNYQFTVITIMGGYPAVNYQFKVNKNARTTDVVMVSLLLTLIIFHSFLLTLIR